MDIPQRAQMENEGMMGLIANQISNLHEDVTDLKVTLKDMASAIIKLALVEERQGQTAIQMERVFTVIERLDARCVLIEARVVVLEVAAPLHKQTSAWTLSAIWSAAGVLALVVLKKLGVL